jgi:2-phosphosulfolactate phosphatase
VRVDVFFLPSELGELPDRVVVIDVLRATSTMAEALANGARAVFPVDTADDAARIAQNIGRDSVILCGERKGLPIEGFDLGNSPGEFTPERVEGQSLVMTTSNGTRAFLAVAERWAAKADPEHGAVLAGSFLNLGAVAREVAKGEGAALVCAGREGRFGLDDALCAGALIRALEADGAVALNDAGQAARRLFGDVDVAERLADTAAGRHLAAIELAADVDFCSRVDRTDVVPRFRDRKITAE